MIYFWATGSSLHFQVRKCITSISILAPLLGAAFGVAKLFALRGISFKKRKKKSWNWAVFGYVWGRKSQYVANLMEMEMLRSPYGQTFWGNIFMQWVNGRKIWKCFHTCFELFHIISMTGKCMRTFVKYFRCHMILLEPNAKFCSIKTWGKVWETKRSWARIDTDDLCK